MRLKSFLFALGAIAVLAARPETVPHREISQVRVPNGGTDGILHLLYFAGDPKAGDLFYVHPADYGTTWSAPLRVNSTAGSAIALGTIRGGQIAMGRNGRIHVAWNGSSAVESSGPLNPEAGQRGAPMLSSMDFAEGAGIVAGAWETGGQVYFENLMMKTAVAVHAPGDGKGRKHPRIAIAPSGQVLMVWTEGTGWQRGGSLAWQFGAVVANPGGFIVLY